MESFRELSLILDLCGIQRKFFQRVSEDTKSPSRFSKRFVSATDNPSDEHFHQDQILALILHPSRLSMSFTASTPASATIRS